MGFIVRDVEATKINRRVLRRSGSPTCDGGKYEVTGTTVNGEPRRTRTASWRFFDLENIQLELIQPNGVKSTWQDFLDEHGEGIHHIAFPVKEYR